eukprot:m.113342 g.113342  ORF g.113342 m.113342 type:complete len:793 (-) comp12798_c1_seq10:13-2391(-)
MTTAETMGIKATHEEMCDKCNKQRKRARRGGKGVKLCMSPFWLMSLLLLLYVLVVFLSVHVVSAAKPNDVKEHIELNKKNTNSIKSDESNEITKDVAVVKVLAKVTDVKNTNKAAEESDGDDDDDDDDDKEETEEGEDEHKPLAELLKEDKIVEEELEEGADTTVTYRLKRLNKILVKRRSLLVKTLQQHMDAVRYDGGYPMEETSTRVEAVNMTLRHINMTFNGYVKMANEVQKVVNSDFNTYESTMSYFGLFFGEQRKHIDELQLQTMREHSELHKLMETKTKLEEYDAKRISKPVEMNKVDRVLERVDDKAKALQLFLNDHAFMKAQLVEDSHLVTVVKIVSHEHAINLKMEQNKHVQDMAYLVDADSNQYTLSKPADTTSLLEDVNLLNDIIFLLCGCFCASLICHSLKLPDFIGYVAAGTILGPSGLNIISSVVAISTIGELGVFFVLFTLGMEFSISKLRDLFHISVVGSTLTMVFVVSVFGIAGKWLNIPLPEALYVGIIVSLSSTTVVANNLTAHEHETSYGRGILGILLMQDVYLGLIIALAPMFAAFDEVKFSQVAASLVWVLFSFVLLGVISLFITKVILGRLLRVINGSGAPQRLLSALALCFLMLKITEYMHISMELGCFVAGVMLSSVRSHSQTTLTIGGAPATVHHGGMSQVLHLVEPVKDLFLAVFFSSVGMHVYPTFLLNNAWLLITLLLCTVVVKYISATLALHWVMRPSVPWKDAHVIGVGLSQVSEFAFVLAGRGRRFQIISQPVYFLLLSITTITLLIAPILWRFVVKPKQ